MIAAKLAAAKEKIEKLEAENRKMRIELELSRGGKVWIDF